MIRILYLEDEENIRDVTFEYLKLNHYIVDIAEDGQRALDLLSTTTYDLVILDIMVPYVSGLEVLKQVPKPTASIMLTALDDEKTQLDAYNYDCDDYMIKPFSPLLLIKRIEAILRRTSHFPPQKELWVNQEDYQVYYQQKSLQLTISEFLIFDALYQKPHQVFTRDMLLDIIAPDDYMVNDRVVDAHVKNLRKKLPQPYIKTMIGLGYRFQEASNETLA